MEKYLLCIDNGLTKTKSVIYALDGREIASSLIDTIVDSKDDWAEIDMELQWRNTAAVIRDVIARSGICPSDIIGIGNSGHGAGLYCLDSENKPVRKAVSSMDARANSILEQWKREGKSPYDRLYQNFWSGQAIPILSWIKTYERSNYEKIDKIFMVKDWIIFQLTGVAGIEYTDSSNSGLINPLDKTVDREILERFGIGEIYEKIPNLRKSMDIAGTVTKKAAEETGLAEGTPVAGGIFDCIACAVGSGVIDNKRYSLIAGTWNINSGIEENLIGRSETVKCSLYIDIDKYFYVESSATSAVNLEWFVRNIINGFIPTDMPDKELFSMIETGICNIGIHESNVIYTPFLYKSSLSDKLEGSFWGIKPEYGIYHMLKAVYEGVVFAHLKHIENLKKDGIARNKAVLSGGASKSSVWCQMFADILNMEIITTQSLQVGALGAAMCTAVAVGEYTDIESAIRVMVKDKDTYHPNKENHELYMRKYKEFNRIIGTFNRS